jgi:hypothetical protein
VKEVSAAGTKMTAAIFYYTMFPYFCQEKTSGFRENPSPLLAEEKIPCAAGFLHKNFVSFLCFSEKTEKFLHQTDFPQNRQRLALDKPQKIGYNNTIMSRLCDSVAFAMRKVRAS